ncbi:hypothetical protein ACKRZS_005858 [Fusarium odoratissimum]
MKELNKVGSFSLSVDMVSDIGIALQGNAAKPDPNLTLVERERRRRCSAFSSLALSKSLPWTTLAQLEHGTFLENIATRSNGDILTTELWPSAAIYTIRNPHTGHNSLQKLFSVPSIQSIYGLTQVKSSRRGTETFIFVGGNSTSPGNTITGSFGAWAVDFDLLNNVFQLRKVGDMGTDSRFLNGVTALPGISDIVPVADSTNGLVGRLNITTGIFDTSAFRYPLEMDPVESARLPIGINGIKIRGGHLYWTNSFQASIYRIAITPNGYPAKGNRPEIVADLSNGVGFLDDFSFDVRGNMLPLTLTTLSSESTTQPRHGRQLSEELAR